jgi:glutamyl-tRNA synthetase
MPTTSSAPKRRDWQSLVRPRLEARGVTVTGAPSLAAIIDLHKGARRNLNELADLAEVFYIDLHPKAELLAKHLTPETLPVLADFVAHLPEVAWEAAAIGALIKDSVARHGLKMPKLAMPLRVLLTGLEQTPSVDALVADLPARDGAQSDSQSGSSPAKPEGLRRG